MKPLGFVSLVGAGPGDPGLLTLHGLERLREAEVVVYDRLVAPSLLREARPGAELLYVGKSAGHNTLSQPEINRLLIDRAKQGKAVVRLKGGDPFVFGRGGEEATALAAEGISFEVIPGVTSAVAAPAYAGIPVTHRGLASSFAVVTGHEDPAKLESQIDWTKLAKACDTLVFLMGIENLPLIVEQLVRHGRDPETPVALIRWGTTLKQETLEGTLGTVVRLAQERGFQPPAVTVVGEVVSLRRYLRWFDSRPLFGKRILVTRSRDQASELSRQLEALGAEAVELPAIRIEPPTDWEAVDAAISRLSDCDWVIFTSVNGVDYFFNRLRELSRDGRSFGRAKLAAIGPGTAAALERCGLLADVVPHEYVAEAVVAELAKVGVAGARVLLPRGDIARDALPKGLEASGAVVDQVTVYRTLPGPAEDAEAKQLLADGLIDCITFASSSAVRNLAGLLNGAIEIINRTKVVSIGPVTSRTARELGIRVDAEAQEHTIGGLVQSVIAVAGGEQ